MAPSGLLEVAPSTTEVERMHGQFVGHLAAVSMLLLTFGVSGASGQVTALHIVSQDPPADVLPGYVVHDLMIDFVGEYNESHMIVELSSGSIYQHAFGRRVPPDAFRIGLEPSVVWDSFIAHGGLTVEETVGNFGTPRSILHENRDVFGTEAIDILWEPAGGTSVADQAEFLVARLTLSEDANGTFSYTASANDVEGVAGGGAVTLPITNGVIGEIPEPSTFALLGAALATALAVRYVISPSSRGRSCVSAGR